jgi:hypothetical protein
MAEKYKSSFKNRGFKPREVSNAGVDKILQEGQRQINILKQQFNYEKQQRDRVLAAMKENDAAEKADREQYFRDETDNRRNIQQRVQDNFRIETANIERQGEAEEKIYKSLAGLSETASKKLADLEQERNEKDYADGIVEILSGDIDLEAQAEYQNQADQLQVQSLENEFGADALEAVGGTPLQVERVRSMSAGRRYAYDQARTILAMEQFLPTVKAEIDQNPEIQTVEQRRAYINQRLSSYLKQTGLFGLRSEFLAPALIRTRRDVTSYLTDEGNAEANRMASERLETSRNAFLTDKANLPANAQRYFNDLVRSPGMTFKTARQTLFKTVYTAQNADGSFVFSDNDIANFEAMTLAGKNKPVGEDFGGDLIDYRRQRADKAKEAAQNRNTLRTLELQDIELNAIRVLSSQPGGATEAEIEFAQERYMKVSGGLRSKLIDEWAESNSMDAKGKQRLKDMAMDLAEANKLTPEILASLPLELQNDDTLKNAANRYKELYETTVSQEAVAAIKQEIRTKLGLEGDTKYGIVGAVLASTAVNIYKNKVAELQTAAQDAGKPYSMSQIQNEALEYTLTRMREGFVDPNKASPFYINPTLARSSGEAGFVNVFSATGIDEDDLEVLKEQRKATLKIKEKIAKESNGLPLEYISNPETGKNLLLTEDQARQVAFSFWRPGYKVPARINEIAREINKTPIQVINAQLKAYGMEPIQPPPSMELLETVRPEVRAGLLNANTPNRSIRFLSQSNQTWNSGAIPVQAYVPFIEEAAKEFNIPPAIIAGLIEQESNWQMGLTSSEGAQGLTQFMPGTAAEYGVDVNDPRSSIMGAARYLRTMMDNNGWSIERALYGYNAGPGGGVGLSRENREFTPGVLEKAGKYGYRQSWSSPATMRPGMGPRILSTTGSLPLSYYSNQVSSVTFDTNQPGIDVFFEDKKFPAVLPGVVKDIRSQYNPDGSGYGNFVIIGSIDPATGESVDVLYSHLAQKPRLVVGQQIGLGQIIGTQGGTGSVQSYDGTIASIDFLAPAPQGSTDMTPYSNYQSLREQIAAQLNGN